MINKKKFWVTGVVLNENLIKKMNCPKVDKDDLKKFQDGFGMVITKNNITVPRQVNRRNSLKQHNNIFIITQ